MTEEDQLEDQNLVGSENTLTQNYKWAICKLDKLGTDISCKKEYKTGGSTKNCIDHLLNKHNLCSDGPKDDQV